jgi:lipopolysaccharide/colanic/teichoic acid biosynthesis glycosyltransferase
MNKYQIRIKRNFDIVLALGGIIVFIIPMLIIACFIKISERGPVFFFQERIGKDGKLLWVIKFRTMQSGLDTMGYITTAQDNRITPVGRILRKYKLDELPQLLTVLTGGMSFVGPRPDVPGYADMLSQEDRIILSIRPGITGPASLFFRYEEEMLCSVENSKEFNDTLLWPYKVKLNKEYLSHWSFLKDMEYITITLFPIVNSWFRLFPPSPRTASEFLEYLEKKNEQKNVSLAATHDRQGN